MIRDGRIILLTRRRPPRDSSRTPVLASEARTRRNLIGITTSLEGDSQIIQGVRT